jgi:hypothetical protein
VARSKYCQVHPACSGEIWVDNRHAGQGSAFFVVGGIIGKGKSPIAGLLNQAALQKTQDSSGSSSSMSDVKICRVRLVTSLSERKINFGTC